jgi:hypothetical protein
MGRRSGVHPCQDPLGPAAHLRTDAPVAAVQTANGALSRGGADQAVRHPAGVLGARRQSGHPHHQTQAPGHLSVLVECWAHQGPPKSAQRHKVLADAFKLTWISTTMYPRPRLILCLSDPLAAAPFLPGGRSWAARAFQDLGVSISVVDLPVELRQDLLQAQRRQYR